MSERVAAPVGQVLEPRTLAASSDRPAAGPIGSFGWLRLNSSMGPSPRADAATTYDARDGYSLLFGGREGSWLELNDSWVYAAGLWNKVPTASSPSARYGASMVYDSRDGNVLLFGGVTGAGISSETWRYSGGTWSQLTQAPSPPGRAFASMCYDAADAAVVLFGGYDNSIGGDKSDTWEYVGGNWTQVGGGLTPNPRSDAGMAFDPTTGSVVLFGGESLDAAGFFRVYNDTWSFAHGTWTNLTGGLGASPSARSDPAISYAVNSNGLLLFGGETQSPYQPAKWSNDTWLFSAGSWTLLAPVSSPPGSWLPSGVFWMVADSRATAVVLFGALISSSGGSIGAWAWGTPLAGSATVTPSTADIGTRIAFSSTASGGFPPYRYGWSLGDGQLLQAATGDHAYFAPSTYVANDALMDSVGETLSLSVTIQVNPAPSIGAVVVYPQATYAGQAVQAQASVFGGTPPYSFHWNFTDGGYSSAFAPTHVYPSAGNHSILLTVGDSFGQTTTASASVTVLPNAPSRLPPHPPSPESSLGFPLAAEVIAGALILAIVWRQRTRRSPTTR